MKIIHLITGLKIGGTEIFLSRILPEIKNHDHLVVSLTKKGVIGLDIEKNSIPVYELNSGKWFSPFSIWRFKKIVEEEKPDVLVTYLIHAAIFGRVFGKLFGVPKIICMIRSQLKEKKHKIYFWVERATQNLVDYFVSNSESLKLFYQRKLGIPERKIKVIYSPVKTNNDDSKPVSFIKEEYFIIGTVCRLAPEKRVEDIIKATNLLKSKNYKIKTLIVGDGSIKGNLKLLAKKLDLTNNIVFVGEQRNVISWMKVFDVFVLVSDYEGMSNALLEAMSIGLPVIGTDMSENREIIKDNENGLLTPVRNPEILAEKIELIIKNQELKNKLSVNSKKFIIENFSLQNFIEEISLLVNN